MSTFVYVSFTSLTFLSMNVHFFIIFEIFFENICRFQRRWWKKEADGVEGGCG